MTDAKRYAVECYGGGEGLGAPALAVFDLDRETAAFIVTMARLIRQHQIHKIERYDFRVWYFETAPATISTIHSGRRRTLIRT
jgi:hypothetical protein